MAAQQKQDMGAIDCKEKPCIDKRADNGGDVGRHSQDNKLAWLKAQDGKEGEADDKAGEGAQVAGPEDEQSVPSTHYARTQRLAAPRTQTLL